MSKSIDVNEHIAEAADSIYEYSSACLNHILRNEIYSICMKISFPPFICSVLALAWCIVSNFSSFSPFLVSFSF